MAPFLSDFFSKEVKEDYLGRKLSLKSIILIKIPEFFDVKYPKYAILVCNSICNGYTAMCPINTNKPITNNCITIYKNDHKFLAYDSYTDCDFISDMPNADVKKFLLENSECIMGEISNRDHTEILQRLRASKIITGKLKKKYNLM